MTGCLAKLLMTSSQVLEVVSNRVAAKGNKRYKPTGVAKQPALPKRPQKKKCNPTVVITGS